MIKELKVMQKKYQEMSKGSEYVSLGQVVNDLHYLIVEARLKRLPKNER